MMVSSLYPFSLRYGMNSSRSRVDFPHRRIPATTLMSLDERRDISFLRYRVLFTIIRFLCSLPRFFRFNYIAKQHIINQKSRISNKKLKKKNTSVIVPTGSPINGGTSMFLVPVAGIEPAWIIHPKDFESIVSANR